MLGDVKLDSAQMVFYLSTRQFNISTPDAMTRLQFALVLILGLVTTLVFAPLTWGVLAPVVRQVAVDATSFARSVPAWVWWTAFGSIWWMPWAFGKRGWMGMCGSRPCASSSARRNSPSA